MKFVETKAREAKKQERELMFNQALAILQSKTITERLSDGVAQAILDEAGRSLLKYMLPCNLKEDNDDDMKGGEDDHKKPAATESKTTETVSPDSVPMPEYAYETPLAARAPTRVEVPLGVAADGKSAAAVAVITTNEPQRPPQAILDAMAEEQLKRASRRKAILESSDSDDSI